MTAPHRLPQLGPAARLFVAILVPSQFRAEFEGDLVEERALLADSGQLSLWWVWSQLLRSTPSLLTAQLQHARPGRRIAAATTMGTLAIAAAYLGIEGGYAGPIGAWMAALLGIFLACLGLFFSTATMRVLPLAAGTGVALVGASVDPEGSLGQFFLLFVGPVFAYSSIDRAIASAPSDETTRGRICRS